MLIQLILSFIAAAGFGFIFNAPKKMLLQCGLVGMIGWIIYWLMIETGIDAVQASFTGGFTVSIISYIMARIYKTPIIIFIVAGIIPLVPGGSAYDAMRHVVSNQYPEAISLAMKAFIISGAIAMGLVFAEVVVQLFYKVLRLGKLMK
ncbi:threonine/serine exporter [bacterium LRH843]|nr:threonine/serine exporter [bacterium LRH843]